MENRPKVQCQAQEYNPIIKEDQQCRLVAVIRITDIAPVRMEGQFEELALCHEHFKKGAMHFYNLREDSLLKPIQKILKRVDKKRKNVLLALKG